MPVKANIPSIGTVIIEGAAEEATMKQLLSVMAKATGGTIPAGGANTPTRTAAAAADRAEADSINKRMKDGADAETRRIAMLKGGGEAANNILAETAKNFSRSFTNTTPSIKDFSGLLSDYLPGAIGDTVAVLGGVFDDQVQIFRQLSQSGIDLGDSLLDTQRKAAQAGLPLEIYARTVKENSQILSMAFGSATQGADKFAEIQGKFSETTGKSGLKLGQQFAALGFSMDELATYNASYMEQVQRSGRLSKMSTEEIIAGQERYNMELDKMSKATGLSRQQIDEANKTAQRDARMKLALSKLDETQQAAVNAKIAQLNQLDPTGQMAAGFKDLIAGGGVALTKEARQFTMTMQSAGVDAGAMARGIFNGSKTAVEDMNAGFSRAAKASEGLTEGERRTAAAMATMGQVTPMLGKAVLQGMGDSTKAAELAKQEQEKRIAAMRTDPTRAAAGLDQVLTQVQNTIKTSLIDTKVFDVTSGGLIMAGDAAKSTAQTFSEASTSVKAMMFFAPATAKEIGSLLASLGKDAIITSGALTAGAAAAKMARDEYKARKAGDVKPDEEFRSKPGDRTSSRAGREVAEEVTEKPGMLQRITGALKRNKMVMAGMTVGGAIVYFHEELMELVTPDISKYINKQVMGALPAGMNTAPGTNTAQTTPASAQLQTQTGQMSREVTELNAALKNTDFSKLMIPENVGTSIDQNVIKLKNLKDTISTTTSAFRELDNVNLNKLNDSINKLSTVVERQPTTAKAENTSVTGVPVSGKEMTELLNQLNMNIGQMVAHQSDAVDYLSKTAKNTRQSLGNLL